MTNIEIIRYLFAARACGENPGIALDIGAHVGEFSKSLLETGLFARVIAFEPNPVNASALERIAAGNPEFAVVPCAVGAAAGSSTLHCDDNTPTGSLLEYHPGYVVAGEVKTLQVPVVTVDGYLASTPAPGIPVSLLKVDSQGHDRAVLAGASRTLARDRPIVIAELIYLPLYRGQAHPRDIAADMDAHGYELYSLFNIHASVEGRLAYADALFVPRELQVRHSQTFVQLDNHASLESQIRILDEICRQRLEVINVLDAEVKRLALAARDPQHQPFVPEVNI